MKTKINIEISEEKLSALTMFLSQKNADLEKEISDYVETLYQKHVPAAVREFISGKSGGKEAKILRSKTQKSEKNQPQIQSEIQKTEPQTETSETTSENNTERASVESLGTRSGIYTSRNSEQN